MVPIDADGSHENNDENRLLLKFIALFQLLMSIATIAPATSEPAKPPKLVVSKKKGAYKQMWPVHILVCENYTVNLEKYRKSYFCPIKGCTSTKLI